VWPPVTGLGVSPPARPAPAYVSRYRRHMAATDYCDATFYYHDGLAPRGVDSPVLDARIAAGNLEFERSGFTRVDHRSNVTDWTDLDAVDRVYRPEMETFALDFTGCDVAIAYPLINRSLEMAETEPDYAPIEFVHSDFTDDYGPMATEPDRPYRQFLDPLLKGRGLGREVVEDASRLMVLQWWRNTGPVEADYPLAVCDAESIPRSRLIAETIPTYGGLRLDFQIFAVHPPAVGTTDTWYTYPQMSDDEVLVIRTYDSACVDQGRAFWTPHSAFRDPKVPSAPEHRRASVEARALCIWHTP
jgi:hypothetical protein